MFSGVLHLVHSDLMRLAHIGKSENIYSDTKYSL